MCSQRDANATLFLVSVLSRGPFNSSWSRDGNLWKQDKLGYIYPTPTPFFFSFTLEVTKLEVGHHESYSITWDFLLLTLKFSFLLESAILKPNLMTCSRSTFEMLFARAVTLPFSGLMKKSVTMLFPVSKATRI